MIEDDATNTLKWFALTVLPWHERTVAAKLRKKGFEVYVPARRERRQWSDRIKDADYVLFPGYVFARFKYSDRRRLMSLGSISSIVSAGGGPITVDENDIAAVRTLTEAKLPISLVPFLHKGQKVVITRGPLASLRGVIVRTKNVWRVVVSIEAVGCAVSVEVDADAIDEEHLLGH